MTPFNINPKLFWSLITISFFSCAYYCTFSEIKEWDESRNGVNAYEMTNNKNYIVPYFENQIDTWNAKPPLFIWGIVASYKIWGYNTFALRFPSLLATILFFIFFYRLSIYFVSSKIAIFSIIILLSSKAVLWDHIGLTGDFDSLLLATLFMFLFYLVKYSYSGNRRDLIIFSSLIGIAFYTKGFAAFILLPSCLLFYIFRNKIFSITTDIKKKDLLLSVTIVSIFIASWIILSINCIEYPENNFYKSSNQIETMFYHDIFNRLFNQNFDLQNKTRSWLFFFSSLDIRMNIWNYLFYLFMVLNIFKINLPSEEKQKCLLFFSYLMIIPIALLLTITYNQHNWYLGPIYPFVALIISINIYQLVLPKKAYIIIIILIGFVYSRHTYELLSTSKTTLTSKNINSVISGKTVYYTSLPQHYLLKLIYAGVELKKVNEDNMLNDSNISLYIVKSNDELVKENTNEFYSLGEFLILAK